MKSFIVLGLAMLATSASATTFTVKAGEDYEAVCLMLVQPGDTCYLESGNYYFDALTRTHGTADQRITITGDSDACIRGSGDRDRVLQIAHDYYTVEGLCFNGQHGDKYMSTAIYVLGADYKTEKNGVISSVTGFQMFNNHIKKFGEECVHLKYMVTHAEVSGNLIEHCGIEIWVLGGGGKVGEGIYIGTSLSQVDDGKAPEFKLRTGGADNIDIDVCTQNWIHDNTFRTYGNECVDIKEGSTNNLVEHNVCEHQQDPNSGCFGSRGSGNTFRYNEISNCVGAGVRVGGGDGYGEGNNMYGNIIKNCDKSAFRVMAPKQGTVCENTVSGVSVFVMGSDEDQSQFTEIIATGGCTSFPGDLGHGNSAPSPATAIATLLPSPSPEAIDTLRPSFAPEAIDTLRPSFAPEAINTLRPSFAPEAIDTLHPSFAPEAIDTLRPSFAPEAIETLRPSFAPEAIETLRPSFPPEAIDTLRPSPAPEAGKVRFYDASDDDDNGMSGDGAIDAMFHDDLIWGDDSSSWGAKVLGANSILGDVDTSGGVDTSEGVDTSGGIDTSGGVDTSGGIGTSGDYSAPEDDEISSYSSY